MFPTLRRLSLTVSLLAGVLAAGCGPLNVHSYTETGATLNFRTYAWAVEESVPTGDPRLDNNRFFSERVRASVDRELAARGFEKTPVSPDLLLHYHASLTQAIEIASPSDRFEHCQNCGTSVYDAGTLVIDLVDARSSRLVWRGWAEKVDTVIDNQAWMEQTIDLTVARIIKRLPPRS
jgi:hypothetical protein